MRKKVVATLFFMCLLVVGCAQISGQENSENILVQETSADEPGEGSEETHATASSLLVDKGWIEIYEEKSVQLNEMESLQITQDCIVTENEKVNFGEVYGELESAYLLYPAEEQYYVLLQAGCDEIKEDYVLLYQLSEQGIVLCQEIYGGEIEEVESLDKIKLQCFEKDLGYVYTYGLYKLDESTQTLVSAEEWKEMSMYLTVQEAELPVVLDGQEALLALDTELKLVKSNLQGTIQFVIEETGEEGVLTYEIDDDGTYIIGGKPAGVYFERGLIEYYKETNLYEREIALEEVAEEGEVIFCETIEQGEHYTYYICDMGDAQGDWVTRRIISVYDGERLVQTIEQDWPTYALYSATDTRIWEQDANFDGVKDIVFFDCYTGNQSAALYSCYLAEGSSFVECESFYGIVNPRFDTENKIVSSYSRGSAVSYTMTYYKYNGTEFEAFREDSYRYDEELGGHIMEEAHPFWNYMMLSEDLSEEEWNELQRFYPVFCQDEELTLWYGAEEKVGVTNFDGIPELIVSEEWPSLQFLEEFVFVDMTGDGKKELVLSCGDIGGCVVVLLEENGEFYASVQGNRCMQCIYEDGMFMESGGASNWTYYKMDFENGKFRSKTIADHYIKDVSADWDTERIYYFDGSINGKKVDYMEFLLWEAENTCDLVEWNIAKTSGEIPKEDDNENLEEISSEEDNSLSEEEKERVLEIMNDITGLKDCHYDEYTGLPVYTKCYYFDAALGTELYQLCHLQEENNVNFEGTWNRTEIDTGMTAKLEITNQDAEGFDVTGYVLDYGYIQRLNHRASFIDNDLAICEIINQDGQKEYILFERVAVAYEMRIYATSYGEELGYLDNATVVGGYTRKAPEYTNTTIVEDNFTQNELKRIRNLLGDVYYEHYFYNVVKYGVVDITKVVLADGSEAMHYVGDAHAMQEWKFELLKCENGDLYCKVGYSNPVFYSNVEGTTDIPVFELAKASEFETIMAGIRNGDGYFDASLGDSLYTYCCEQENAEDFTGDWSRTNVHSGLSSSIEITNQDKAGFDIGGLVGYFLHGGRLEDGRAYFVADNIAIYEYEGNYMVMEYVEGEMMVYVSAGSHGFHFGNGCSMEGEYTLGDPEYTNAGLLENNFSREELTIIENMLGEDYYQMYFEDVVNDGSVDIRTCELADGSKAMFYDGYYPTMAFCKFRMLKCDNGDIYCFVGDEDEWFTNVEGAETMPEYTIIWN